MLRSSPGTSPHGRVHRTAYPSGQFSGAIFEGREMALLALSHTPLENQLYRAMLSEVARVERTSAAFSVRGLTALTGIQSPSTIRRTLAGLLRKLSIQKTEAAGETTRAPQGFIYQIFQPEEIFKRRSDAGLPPYPKEMETYQKATVFFQAIEHVLDNSQLSRREAQVALACAEGLTNAEIGQRLIIGEQTVKFHLRNIFVKFGVRRRTELISRLLTQDAPVSAAKIESSGEL